MCCRNFPVLLNLYTKIIQHLHLSHILQIQTCQPFSLHCTLAGIHALYQIYSNMHSSMSLNIKNPAGNHTTCRVKDSQRLAYGTHSAQSSNNQSKNFWKSFLQASVGKTWENPPNRLWTIMGTHNSRQSTKRSIYKSAANVVIVRHSKNVRIYTKP